VTDEIATRLSAHRDLLELLVSQSEASHNHKETMAHAGVLVQVAVLAGVLSPEHWPPPWIPEVRLAPRLVAGVGFVLAWLLFHVFVRWQLRNRRADALFQAALLGTLRKWANNPGDAKLDSATPTGPKPSRWAILLDHVFPYPPAQLHYDVGRIGWPADLADEWKAVEETGTGTVRSEWLLWVGSVFGSRAWAIEIDQRSVDTPLNGRGHR
jgi:hypothetical protein